MVLSSPTLMLHGHMNLKFVIIIFLFTGMIEMVTDAETLRKIQVELGLTGSFKDRSIAGWLAKHNPSALDYERAVENFTGTHWHIIHYVQYQGRLFGWYSF